MMARAGRAAQEPMMLDLMPRHQFGYILPAPIEVLRCAAFAIPCRNFVFPNKIK
jgi:hypothetical protein